MLFILKTAKVSLIKGILTSLSFATVFQVFSKRVLINLNQIQNDDNREKSFVVLEVFTKDQELGKNLLLV